jgi:hypothetical protein
MPPDHTQAERPRAGERLGRGEMAEILLAKDTPVNALHLEICEDEIEIFGSILTLRFLAHEAALHTNINR